MPNNATITHDQLRTLFLATELGGNTQDVNRFTYAEKGSSTYTFGLLQFDVGKNGAEVKGFLKDNGFSADDIKKLSQHGGLSRTELNALDVKLRAVLQDNIDRFTNKQLDKSIAGVDDVIDQVRKQNPAAADAISKDAKLQLGIADYENQFGPAGPQFVGFLAGKPEKLAGGAVQAGDTPSREDIQNFIGTTAYGHDKVNAKAVESRAERFDEAMGTLKLSPATKAPSHTSDKAGSVLKQGAHGAAVHELQADLAKLGYTGDDGKPLKADGHFGPDTRHAVERFQHDHHLEVDGIVGLKTLKALDHVQSKNAAPNLATPKNPDHALYQQALAGVHMLDANLGRKPDQQSDQLAAGLVVAAKREGMTKIDNVMLSEDGSRAFAVQGKLDSPLRQIAHVQTAEAVNTPIEQNSAAWQQLVLVKQAEPTPVPLLATPHEQQAPFVMNR
ncbi:MAG TPA: peptidoglycan-binding domain-containing protein [Rhodanobacter sp.]|nr:peptidoglycan-binding domain-containing protein [Rhodanobacter sp.]